MKLTDQEYQTFLNIHPRLIHYAGLKKGVINKNVNLEGFLNLSIEKMLPARDALYNNLGLIDEYIGEHSDFHSSEEISIIKEMKNIKKGTFFITKFLKKHALFMGDTFVYAVLALGDPFDYFWDKRELPAMVETVLLPFKGKIVYDGIFRNTPMRFGRNYTSSLKNEADKKIGQYGVILTLPIDDKIKNKKINPEETLKVLMKTQSSRDQNWYEIDELLEDNIKLYPIYYSELGRINSRNKKKKLKLMGIKNYHFAIYDDIIVTSGKSLDEIKKRVKEISTGEDFLNSLFYFKV